MLLSRAASDPIQPPTRPTSFVAIHSPRARSRRLSRMLAESVPVSWMRLRSWTSSISLSMLTPRTLAVSSYRCWICALMIRFFWKMKSTITKKLISSSH